MPLVITLRTGESLYVADSKFTLARIKSEDKVEIRRCTDGVVFAVSTDKKVEVEDEVFVQLGDRMTRRAARRQALESLATVDYIDR